MIKQFTSFFLILFFSFSNMSFSNPNNWDQEQKDLLNEFSKGKYKNVEKKLKSGVDPNFNTALEANRLIVELFNSPYFTKEKIKALRILIKYKIEISKIDDYGNTILHYARDKEFKKDQLSNEFVSLLKDVGLNLDEKNNIGVTPAIAAAKHGNVKYIEALKRNGADLALTDNKGESVVSILKEISKNGKYHAYSASNSNFVIFLNLSLF